MINLQVTLIMLEKARNGEMGKWASHDFFDLWKKSAVDLKDGRNAQIM